MPSITTVHYIRTSIFAQPNREKNRFRSTLEAVHRKLRIGEESLLFVWDKCMKTRFESSLQKQKWNELEFCTAYSGHHIGYLACFSTSERVRSFKSKYFKILVRFLKNKLILQEAVIKQNKNNNIYWELALPLFTHTYTRTHR
jgi:hypothetical protein